MSSLVLTVHSECWYYCFVPVPCLLCPAPSRSWWPPRRRPGTQTRTWSASCTTKSCHFYYYYFCFCCNSRGKDEKRDFTRCLKKETAFFTLPFLYKIDVVFFKLCFHLKWWVHWFSYTLVISFSKTILVLDLFSSFWTIFLVVQASTSRTLTTIGKILAW